MIAPQNVEQVLSDKELQSLLSLISNPNTCFGETYNEFSTIFQSQE